MLTWRSGSQVTLRVQTPYPDTMSQGHAEPIQPLPTQDDQPPAKVRLGRQLFHDPILSADGSIACASCHSMTQGGSDGAAVSVGVGGARGLINAPTVFNARYNLAQFWDGRSATLEDQVAGPIHNPLEMNSNWGSVLARLRQREDYREAFRLIYPEGITARTVADAIASFERSLTTPDAPFDRYLRGESGALTPEALEGYARFKRYGCASCHQGINVGGNLFQRFGIMGDYFADRGNPTTADLGRYNHTGQEADRHVFKVPSLRNVALTPPYFHDGSTDDLEEAITIMARYQLGRSLTDEDTRLIAHFLESLTGNLPAAGAGP